MKKCSKCQTENPSDAKFCRTCGSEFKIIIQNVQNVKWKDTSLVKITNKGRRFQNALFFLSFFVGVYIFLYGIYLYSDDSYPPPVTAIFLFIPCPILLIINFYRFSYGRRKTTALHNVASSIEVDGSINALLMKGGKMGLYDWQKRKVLLGVEYDSIERMDEKYYFKINRNGKYGIYSAILKKIILNCQCDDVYPFENNIANVIIKGTMKKVDTQGNIF